jgi:hypothetical protein
MAITTVQSGAGKFRVVKVTRPCLGPGGVVLEKGRTVRIPEADAYTLTSGGQAEFVEDADQAEKK